MPNNNGNTNYTDNPVVTSPLGEIGDTGLRRQNGLIQEEFHKDLKGRKAIEKYKEMSNNDAVISAVLYALNTLIGRVTWNVEDATDDSEDLRASELVRTSMDDMSMTWSNVIEEVCSFFVYGFSWHEIVYKFRRGQSRDPKQNSRYNDGLIGWRKMPIRSQDSLYQWLFDSTGGVQAFVQQLPYNYYALEGGPTTPHSSTGIRAIPIEKSLLFRTTSRKNSPEGHSLLRNSYTAYYRKTNIENIEGIGVERGLAGMPVAWVPSAILDPTSTNTQAVNSRMAIERIVRNLKRDEQEGILWPLEYDEHGNKKFDLTLLTAGQGTRYDTNSIINRYDQRIAQTVLADAILVGHTAVGSQAMLQSKMSLLSAALTGYVQGIAEVFNRYAIPRLLEMNGIQVDDPPKIVPSPVEDVDLKDLGEFIKNLALAGATLFPDDKLENYLRAAGKLPERDEEAIQQQQDSMMQEQEMQMQAAQQQAQMMNELKQQTNLKG